MIDPQTEPDTEPDVVTARWLAEHLDDPDLCVVDTRWTSPGSNGVDSYLQGHIPGSVYVDWRLDTSDPGASVEEREAASDRFIGALGEQGVGSEMRIVVYDDAGGMVAGRLWWSLQRHGHDRVAILDGGILQWAAEGRPFSAEPSRLNSVRFVSEPRPELRSTTDEVIAALDDPETLILDTRPAERYRGADAGDAQRAGRIPGSVNVPSFDTLSGDTFLLRPDAELREMYRSVGVFDAKRVIATCDTGVAAAHTLLVLHRLGYDSGSLYEGSWREWSANPDLPSECDEA